MADRLIVNATTGKREFRPLTRQQQEHRATLRQVGVNRENEARERDEKRLQDIADLKLADGSEAWQKLIGLIDERP